MVYKLPNKSLQMKKRIRNAFCGLFSFVPANGFFLGLLGFQKYLQVLSQCPPPPTSKIALANHLKVWLHEIQLPCCCIAAWTLTNRFTTMFIYAALPLLNYHFQSLLM